MINSNWQQIQPPWLARKLEPNKKIFFSCITSILHGKLIGCWFTMFSQLGSCDLRASVTLSIWNPLWLSYGWIPKKLQTRILIIGFQNLAIFLQNIGNIETKYIFLLIYFSQFGEISHQEKKAKIGLNILVKKFTHKCDQTIVLGYTTH